MRQLLLALLFPLPALALSPEAKEFMQISARLEPVQCDEDLKQLRGRVDELNRERETTRLEHRLAELARRISDGKGGTRDPEYLQAISFQQRQAFYRCE